MTAISPARVLSVTLAHLGAIPWIVWAGRAASCDVATGPAGTALADAGALSERHALSLTPSRRAFYERMGARYFGQRPSAAIPERTPSLYCDRWT